MYYLNSRYYDQEIARFINADTIDIISATAGALTEKNLYAYCNNNPLIYSDESGEFAVSAFLISAVAGAAVNLVTTYIAAQVIGQEYTWKDAGVAMASGFCNAIPAYGPVISGLISGGYAMYQSLTSGVSLEKAIACGIVNGICTTAGISNLANWGKVGLTVIEASAIDLVFSTGLNSIGAVTSKAVTYNSIKNSSTKTVTKSKCSVTGSGCSTDYYRYLYNGGMPI